MNPEEFTRLRSEVEALSSKYSEILSAVRGIAIDKQLYLMKNNPIPPGIACKVAFDMNGIILKSEPLIPTDIPALPIDQIAGLRTELGSRVSRTDLDNLRNEMKHLAIERGPIVGTGVKVNFDAHGLVVSVADLLVSDIPMLPMSKIEGLTDIIEFLKKQHVGDSSAPIRHPNINAATAVKVTYDEHGHVIRGEKLATEDLPNEVVSKLNILESKLPELALQSSLNAISSAVSKKVDANPPITSGTFTKVIVDKNGFVVRGDQMTIKDLPAIGINDITGLRGELNQKADRDVVTGISETVGSLSRAISQVSEVLGMKNELKMKADASTVKTLESKINSVQQLLDRLLQTIPGDTIMQQLSQIQNDLSSLDGRVATLEKKIRELIK